MHQHILALFTILPLTTPASIPLPLSHPLTLLPLNLTTPNREPWPRAPWVTRIDDTARIAIEHYGRHVCRDGDEACETRVTDGLRQIVQVIDEEYVIQRDKVDLFRGGPVVLWFRQEKPVPKVVVEALAFVLVEMMGMYGAREVLSSGLVNFGTLAARFDFTVPGIEGE